MSKYYNAFTGNTFDQPPESLHHVTDTPCDSYLVGPGLFDPQVNGFAGVDFQDPNITQEALEHAGQELLKHGCTHFLPTLITASADFLTEQFSRMAGFINQSDLLKPMVPGFHLEGPFLSPEKGFIGAHPVEHVLEPNWELFSQWQLAAQGMISIITIAPEANGSTQFIKQASNNGVWVSLGHSNASLDQLEAAINAGARQFTHLSNGCPPEMHRHDNIIQRVLSQPDLMVSLIPDGIHVPPPVLSNFTKFLGDSRLIMTTDAMSAAGAEPGIYKLAHLQLEIGADRIVRLPGTNQFAGSSLTPLQGFYNCIRFGGLDARSSWHAWTNLRRKLFPEIDPSLIAIPFF